MNHIKFPLLQESQNFAKRKHWRKKRNFVRNALRAAKDFLNIINWLMKMMLEQEIVLGVGRRQPLRADVSRDRLHALFVFLSKLILKKQIAENLRHHDLK